MSGHHPLQAQNYTVQGEDAREGMSAWLGSIGRLRYSPSWRSDSGGMLSTVTFLHLNSQIVRQMSLLLSPANQNAPCACAWREKDRYKKAKCTGNLSFRSKTQKKKHQKRKLHVHCDALERLN